MTNAFGRIWGRLTSSAFKPEAWLGSKFMAAFTCRPDGKTRRNHQRIVHHVRAHALTKVYQLPWGGTGKPRCVTSQLEAFFQRGVQTQLQAITFLTEAVDVPPAPSASEKTGK